MSPRPVERAAALLLALACAAGAAAKTGDRNQPMDIEAAQSVCGLGANATCTLTGNVVITQGSLRVNAPKAILQQSGNDPSRAQLSGGVALRQQLDDGTEVNATAANVDYDFKTEVVVFTGNVQLRQQRGTLSGERVVYNMKTGQVEGGGPGSGRVRMQILPRSAQAAPKAGG
ncbi:lipopolysaccharide transport periplasmic protein LptA [Thermomonas flagellata]|jgi:lipopolysaccharide export system protein LptA|uniref:lipopolysaccharide transport periplasmic protein LptA n=1 Tax=Thermomonas flagellata TaxID=2888524 RepID=UPI001F0392A6|nr:lipopolysaccharide transport periplasmic protein LptA [Thermomonas flagellata]